MHADKLLSWKFWQRSLVIFRTATPVFFGLGVYLGVIAISMCQQWSLTFGQDPQFLLAQSLILALSGWLGQRWQSSRRVVSESSSLAALIICLSFWAILHPFWIDALTTVMGVIPIDTLESKFVQALVACSLAILGWTIPGMLWAAVVVQGALVANHLKGPVRQSCAVILCGVVCGMLLNSLVLAPWFGVFVPTVAAALIASCFGWWFRRTETSVSCRARSNRQTTGWVLRAVMACLTGGLLACNLRLANQLMPHCPFVLDVQIAGGLLGMAAGIVLGAWFRSTTNRAAWGGLFAAAVSSALLALQPFFINLSLGMNATFSTVAFLLAARLVLLMAIACPFGAALVWITDSIEEDHPGSLFAWMTAWAGGLGIATFLLGGFVGLIPLMMTCSAPLIVAAGYLFWRDYAGALLFRPAVGMVCLLAIALSLPRWSFCDDASRTAKLLFSTPAFIAYRSGWEIEHLTQLDDVRMIDRLEGRTGPLTLWRGRVAELYLREAGIPRAVVTKNVEIVPQFPVEVLQVIYPLVLSERPGRLLFLGLSSGVSLSTSLAFPIQEAVCLESDGNLIEMVRGPVARETGFDPLNDDRVTLKRISPEVALMANLREAFDVIISSPLSSSMADGSASYTQEFYQRASRQLSERGIFCQRVECIDHGPVPLQLTLKAIRQAFTRVIAIEMAAGELLVLGANAENAFVTDNLAARLESPHVCRLLAQSGLDWSTLLNFPAFDHAAIAEICEEFPRSGNSTIHGQLAATAPLELMRWGNKQGEVQQLLTATRISPAPFWTGSLARTNGLEPEIQLSRRSRLIDWLGDAQASKELVRRLAEVADQQKIVRENPDQHWWAYRRVLRRQLQDRPRSAVQQVKAIDEKPTMHPEDAHRRDYFAALGKAVQQQKPTREQIADLEEYLEPYDPFVSYFGRQETADLLARCGEDASQELAYRLYVIYFAPTVDASVRNVAKALEALVNHPDTIPDESIRFDAINGLIQTLRVRWEIRQNVRETSSQKILDDVDQSLVAVEKGVTTLDSLTAAAGVTDQEWQTRKNVIERLMLRPLRTYRSELQMRQLRGQAKTRSIIEEADQVDQNDGL